MVSGEGRRRQAVSEDFGNAKRREEDGKMIAGNAATLRYSSLNSGSVQIRYTRSLPKEEHPPDKQSAAAARLF